MSTCVNVSSVISRNCIVSLTYACVVCSNSVLQNVLSPVAFTCCGSSHLTLIFSQCSGPVYHEYCDCPEVDSSIWQSTMQCPADEPQILDDFKSFPKVDLKRLRQEVPHRFSNRGGLIHYAIVNNKVYRRTLGKYTDFKMFSDEMLLSLTRKVVQYSAIFPYCLMMLLKVTLFFINKFRLSKVRVPDVEFFINVGDWPLETRRVDAVPVLSWCGSTDTQDIVLPTYEVTHSTLETMRGVTNDLLSVQGHTGNTHSNSRH